MRLLSSPLPLAPTAAAALLLLLAAAAVPTAEAKVGKTKLSPDGLETSEMGLGALHFAELDGGWVLDVGVVGGLGRSVGSVCLSGGLAPWMDLADNGKRGWLARWVH